LNHRDRPTRHRERAFDEVYSGYSGKFGEFGRFGEIRSKSFVTLTVGVDPTLSTLGASKGMALPLDRHRKPAAARFRNANQPRRHVFDKESGLLQGTVELLVLKTLTWGPMHGYGIASWIESVTADALSVEEGSLYPALYRMAKKRWITAEWGLSENNRRAKYYRLTAEGRRQFRDQTSGWRRFASAVDQAIGSTVAPSWAK